MPPTPIETTRVLKPTPKSQSGWLVGRNARDQTTAGVDISSNTSPPYGTIHVRQPPLPSTINVRQVARPPPAKRANRSRVVAKTKTPPKPPQQQRTSSSAVKNTLETMKEESVGSEDEDAEEEQEEEEEKDVKKEYSPPVLRSKAAASLPASEFIKKKTEASSLPLKRKNQAADVEASDPAHRWSLRNRNIAAATAQETGTAAASAPDGRVTRSMRKTRIVTLKYCKTSQPKTGASSISSEEKSKHKKQEIPRRQPLQTNQTRQVGENAMDSCCSMCGKTAAQLQLSSVDEPEIKAEPDIVVLDPETTLADHSILCIGANPYGLFERCPWCLAQNNLEVLFTTSTTTSHATVIETATSHYSQSHNLTFTASHPFAAVYADHLVSGKLGIIIDPLDYINFNRSWGRDMGFSALNSALTPQKYRKLYAKLANAPAAMEVSHKPSTLDVDLMYLYEEYDRMFRDYFKARPIHYELHATSAANAVGSVYRHLRKTCGDRGLKLRMFGEDGSDFEVKVGYARGSFGGGFGAAASNSYLREDKEGEGVHAVVPNGEAMVFELPKDGEDGKKLFEEVKTAVVDKRCGAVVVEMVNNQGEVLTAGQWKRLAGVCTRLKILLVVDECLTAIRCGLPFAWHDPKYSSIAKPDMVIFGKGLLVAGLAIVPDAQAFKTVPAGAIDNAILKWKPKVTCMLPPQQCLTAAVALSTAIEQNWVERAVVVGAAIARILYDMSGKIGFEYKSVASMIYLYEKVGMLPFVTAPAGKVTRLWPPLHLNNYDLGMILDKGMRKVMLAGLKGEKPLVCFSCGDGTDVVNDVPQVCKQCGWYRCENCLWKVKRPNEKKHICFVV